MNRPIRYEFVSNFDSNETADKECTKYYQICYFPQKNKHQVRKFLIDKNYDYKSVKDHYVSKEKLQQFMKNKKCNEYKIFAVYNLDNINYPTMAEIITCQSNMITTNYKYYGCSPF